jgi:Neprosin
MGSGRKSNEGWQKAAFQNLILYIDTSTVSQWADLDEYESNPECYTADIHNITGNWGTYRASPNTFSPLGRMRRSHNVIPVVNSRQYLRVAPVSRHMCNCPPVVGGL